jgi:hypothetical protein
MGNINKDLKHEITVAVVKLAFTEQIQAWQKKDHALMDAIVERAYSKKIRDHMAGIDELVAKEFPDKSAFIQRTQVSVNVGGYQLDVGSSGYYGDMCRTYDYGYQQHKVNVLKFHDGSRLLDLTSDDKLGQKVSAHIEARQALNAEMKKALLDVEAALSTIRTVKQCQQQWPEIMPIIEELMPEAGAKPQLPMTLRMELNMRLKLPPKKTQTEQLAVAA